MERRIMTGATIEEEAGTGTQGERFHQGRKMDHHQAALVLAHHLRNIT